MYEAERQWAQATEEAIVLLHRESSIRVVFTEVDLPGTMDGFTLAHYVRHRWPPTILLVSSGRMPSHDNALPRNAEFVLRPFVQGRLAKAVRKAHSAKSQEVVLSASLRAATTPDATGCLDFQFLKQWQKKDCWRRP